MNNSTTAVAWALRPALPGDLETIADLRAEAMRPDLERLGRYDDDRVRQRLRDVWAPEHTSVIEVGGAFAGSVTLRPIERGRWLENFYIAPEVQGRGIGTAVLRSLLTRADEAGAEVRLIVVQGSAARPLYERHGFVEESHDPIDVYMVRRPVRNASAAVTD